MQEKCLVWIGKGRRLTSPKGKWQQEILADFRMSSPVAVALSICSEEKRASDLPADFFWKTFPSIVYLQWDVRKSKSSENCQEERTVVGLPRASILEIQINKLYIYIYIPFIVADIRWHCLRPERVDALGGLAFYLCPGPRSLPTSLLCRVKFFGR